MSAVKRSKLDVRQFQKSWTTDFEFVCRNDRAVCALCCENVVCRTSSIKHHFENRHKKLFKDDSEKNEALKKAVSRCEKQNSIFKKAIRSTNQTTESSYKVAECIAKSGKPFTNSDFIKEIFINFSEVFFADLPNKNVILSRNKNLPVSARTERRLEDMAADVIMQPAVALQSVNTFSVALDESMDVNDIPRLAIIARYCSDDNVQEELCCLSPMYGSTKGAEILQKLFNHFEKRQIDIKKIFAVTADGAAAMVERDCGFVAFIEEKIGQPVLKFHCMIHQESLCAKIPNSNLASVIAITTKIANFIVKRSATTHRQFRSFFVEVESAHCDLFLHCTSRWLSCGKVLVRFIECLDEIKIFLMNQGKHYPELNDEKWLVDLLFITRYHYTLKQIKSSFARCWSNSVRSF